MSAVVGQLGAPKVICLGEALVDRLGPLGGDPLLDKPVDDCLGGAPANVACGLAKLGTAVAFGGRLGDDFIGKRFENLMKLRGVNLAGLQIDSQRPSRVVLVHRDLSGERTFQGFDGDQGNGFADQAFAVSEWKKSWPFLVQNACWLLVGTIPLASQISQEALLWSIDEAWKNDIQIALDINWRPTFWNQCKESGPNKSAIAKISPLLEKVSLLKLAKEEAIWFFHTADPCQISRSLSNNPDVIVTDGARPLTWFLGGWAGEMRALTPLSVVDTTGAGDSFTAGLLHQLLIRSSVTPTKKDTEALVRFAAACGALVCGGVGGIDPQPNHEEVIAFLSDL